VRVAVVLEQCWHRVPGGTARAAVEQARAVEARPGHAGQRVEQVGVAAWHRHPPVAPWSPPVPVRHLPMPRRLLYEAWQRWQRPGVERATGPVDAIHATGYTIPPRTRPLVVTMHDVAWRRDPRHFTVRGVRFFESALRRTRDTADLVLCPSRATMRDCVTAGIEQDRLRHVPWGIAGEVASAGAVADVRSRHGLGKPYILFVGTLEPRKNLQRLVEAVRRLPRDDVELLVVGPVGWGDALDRDELGKVADRVRLLGFVPDRDLAPLYRGAAVMCYPALWEGYGLPVAEALAQGAPVVTSAGTATEELVTGGAGLAVDPRDTDAIAGALARVLDEPEEADRLRRAARERADELTWAETARRTVDAFVSVVAAREVGR
jgi:glycosyltransferase involved in cell wall biosynthesis